MFVEMVGVVLRRGERVSCFFAAVPGADVGSYGFERVDELLGEVGRDAAVDMGDLVDIPRRKLLVASSGWAAIVVCWELVREVEDLCWWKRSRIEEGSDEGAEGDRRRGRRLD